MARVLNTVCRNRAAMSNADDRAPGSPDANSRPGPGRAEPNPAPSTARDPMWTIRELLQWTQQRFTKIGIDGARTDAEHLLAAALGCDRMSLYVRHDDVVPAEVKASYRALVKRRLEREPVAYLLGRRGFHALDLELAVDRRVLVPRPDTEHLVDWVLEELPADGVSGQVLDVGTGSGAVALAIKKARPAVHVTSCDVSEDALALATQNATSAGLEVDFQRSDLLEAVRPPAGGWTAVVANLPYIPSAELDELQPEVSRWEPRLALDGGADGLVLIRRLVSQAATALQPGGGLYLELGIGQSAAVQALLTAAGFEGVAARKDYGDIERVVRGHRPA